MNTKLKLTVVTAIICAGGFYHYILRAPSDLRDAPASSALGALEHEAGAVGITAPEPALAQERGGKLYVAGYPADGVPGRPIEWVYLSGGRFAMGTDDMPGCEEARQVHEVNMQAFEMSRTLVTVEQYSECVIHGKCTLPGNDKNSNAGANCNWGKDGRQFHPVNCVTWAQAKQYAQFMHARLPSEAEFEYAATSGGRSQKYPWGNNAPTSELAVFNTGGTMPVCSKSDGNTAQGLCDMAGNVWQWTQDALRSSYVSAPADGSADESAPYSLADGTKTRVIRGGSFYTDTQSHLRAQFRNGLKPRDRADHTRFRLVRRPR